MASPYYQQTQQDYDYNTQDSRQYEQSQPRVYTQQQPYPSSSFATPHNIPPPPPLPGSSFAFTPPSTQPISAPTPQYPHSFNPASPGAPTSPNGVGPGPFRRPLPTPGAPGQTTIVRSPLPTPGPTPGPSKLPQSTQPIPIAGPTKIPAVPAASSSPVQSPISPAHSPRRPLPIPLPRSPNGIFPENGTRSPSPVRNPTSPSQEASPASPTRFVPYWKRNLPSPNGGSDVAVAGPSSISATIAGSISRNGGSQPVASGSRSKSVDNGRPLPASPAVARPSRMRDEQPVAGPSKFPSSFWDEQPVAGPSNSSPRSPTKSKITNGYASMSEQPIAGPSKIQVASPTPMSPRKPYAPARAPSPQHSGTDDSNSRTPSPQYGIRDLPAKSRSIINHNKASHMRESASTEHDEPVRGRPGRSSTLPQPPAVPVLSSPASRQRSGHRPTQSVTLRATAVFSPVPAASTRKTAGSTPASPSGWSAGLPPLPRAPASPYTKQYAVPHVMNNRREYVDLDEPPPPSLRRSPSPSSSFPRMAAAFPRIPNFRSSQPAAAPPPLPPRKGSASNPPSPKKFTNTLPNVPSLPQRRDNTSGTSRASRFASPERRQPPASAPVATPFGSQNRSQSSFVQQRLDHRQISPERKPELTTSVPNITFSRNPDFDDDDDDDDLNDAWSDDGAPMIAVSAPEDRRASPQITFAPPVPSPMGFGGSPFPMRGADTQTKRKVSAPNSNPDARGSHSSLPSTTSSTGRAHPPPSSARRGGGMACGGCGGPIVGRIVSAMGVRWHPGCFRCCVCNDLLEYISSFEHDGKPYCHLDYHELFAPRCYHCKTAIVDERFITLDDPELGKRTYHEQHFFCSECGDPFLTPSIDRQSGTGGGLTFTGDGEFEDDNVGFTVHRGYPYCESCHVRLRSPKCKRCKQSIRGGQQAVDALGGKWHWECFTCTSCEKPFEDPSFFLRDNKPFCESCFSIIIKSEL